MQRWLEQLRAADVVREQERAIQREDMLAEKEATAAEAKEDGLYPSTYVAGKGGTLTLTLTLTPNPNPSPLTLTPNPSPLTPLTPNP